MTTLLILLLAFNEVQVNTDWINPIIPTKEVVLTESQTYTSDAVLSQSKGWYQCECPHCHQIVYKQQNGGAKDLYYNSENASDKHICHSATLQEMILPMLIFTILYISIIRTKYKKYLIPPNDAK